MEASRKRALLYKTSQNPAGGDSRLSQWVTSSADAYDSRVVAEGKPAEKNQSLQWLRGTHFKMGDRTRYPNTSSSRDDYKPPPKDARPPQTQWKDLQGTASHWPRGDPAKINIRESETRAAFNPEVIKGDARSEPKVKGAMLRATHFKLGGYNEPVTSSSRAAFVPMPTDARPSKIQRKNLQAHHIVLGDTTRATTGVSESSEAFGAKKTQRSTPVTNEQLGTLSKAALQRSHFVAGRDKTMYQTASQSAYVEHDLRAV